MKVRVKLGPGNGKAQVWIDDELWSDVQAIEVKASVNNVARVILTLLPSEVEVEGEVDALEQGDPLSKK